MKTETTQKTINSLLAEGKGILAADESFPTIGKRFKALGIESTEETRLAYRQMLFGTPRLSDSISGVILFDETIRQRGPGGVPMARFISSAGMVPGIKVDAGTDDLPNFPGEKFTMGLDGLSKRLAEYYQMGARFTKWRGVYSVSNELPTGACMRTNARIHALFAALSQAADLVPIVEPEVLMDGDHTIERCAEAATAVLEQTFEALSEQRVDLANILLKTSMVISGKDCPQQAGVGAVAEATMSVFRRAVPPSVGGIVFLSGGQEDLPATRRLNAIERAGPHPWRLTFSYGRALQDAPMEAWAGKPANVQKAQAALSHRARCNSLAVRGAYNEGAEAAA